MQIHHNGKTYRVRPDIELWLIEAIDEWVLELVEETKPTEIHWKYPWTAKQNEEVCIGKGTPVMDKWVDEKIEYVPPFEIRKDAENQLEDILQYQVDFLTTAVNTLISFHNK